MGKYTIDDIRMVSTRYNSIDRNTYLTFNVWHGSVWISIAGSKDNQRIFSKGIRYEEISLITQYMSEFLKAEPGKEQSLVYNSYNRQEKKRVMEFIFVLKKDEKQVFHVIIKANNNVFDFPIIYSNTITFGTGEIPESERSYRAMLQLVTHLKNLTPMQIQMSNVPQEQKQGGSGGYGGKSGGYQQRQGGYGGQGDFQSSKRLPSDDDIFSQD